MLRINQLQKLELPAIDYSSFLYSPPSKVVHSNYELRLLIIYFDGTKNFSQPNCCVNLESLMLRLSFIFSYDSNYYCFYKILFIMLLYYYFNY